MERGPVVEDRHGAEARQIGDLLAEKGLITSETGHQGIVWRIEYAPRRSALSERAGGG
jgi:hypothetical protein